MANYKRIFLDGYSYYLTIVTHQRNPILIDNIELLRESFKVSKKKYDYVIDAIVVLPDHIHMVISPRVAEEYPHIVRTMKQYFSKYCEEHYYAHLEQTDSRWKEGYRPVWQKKYYEHTIRNEKDYLEKVTYIHNNPIRHELVEEIKEWKYSSYHYV